MTGFILAAGFGTRLRPITNHLPKALVSVCGEPLLKRWYDFFKAAGYGRVAANSHYLSDKMEQFIRDNGLACPVFHEQGKIRGTGGALYFARDFLAGEEFFCVANVDIIAEIDLVKLFADFKGLGCCVGLVSVASKRGTVWYDPATMDYCGARSEQSDVPSGCRGELAGAEFLGIAFYKREFLDLLTEEDFSILPAWGRAQQKGLPVRIVDAGGVYWADTGSPEKLARIHFDAIDGKNKLSVPQGMVVDRPGKKAYPVSFSATDAERLGEYSWIECPAMPESSEISRSVVFRDAVVPENVRIAGSLVTKYGVVPFGP